MLSCKKKIKKGLCFRCYGNFGPNHVCKNKQYRVMLMEEQINEGEIDVIEEVVFLKQQKGNHKAL